MVLQLELKEDECDCGSKAQPLKDLAAGTEADLAVCLVLSCGASRGRIDSIKVADVSLAPC